MKGEPDSWQNSPGGIYNHFAFFPRSNTIGEIFLQREALFNPCSPGRQAVRPPWESPPLPVPPANGPLGPADSAS